jgi:hypothetical protein
MFKEVYFGADKKTSNTRKRRIWNILYHGK